MIALADCNSFFASVEKVFHPGLRGKPVCVLSSNDGNIVALSSEAKALGVRRGVPYFEVRDMLDACGAAVFSSNLMLYAAMSDRVQRIMRRSVVKADSYSIDEQFLYLDGYEEYCDLEQMMRDMVDRVLLWTDIPVSVGVAKTKTLAKIAARFAKKYKGYHSVCVIDTEEKRRKALSMCDVSDVWGLGGRTCVKLMSSGVFSALQFADRSADWVRRNFYKPVYQTWLELNDSPCIDTSEMLQRKSIGTSRSFGEMVSDIDALKASIASFASSCANKLRGQGSSCEEVTVFISSNRFREDLPQYVNSASVMLPVPSSDTLEIIEAAVGLVDRIYRPGILYKKSGVVLSGIVDGPIHSVLFDPVQKREERFELSKTMDEINHKYGLKTVKLGVEGDTSSVWMSKSENRTPNYLTDLNEIMTVRI